MQFQADRKALLKALRTASAIIPRKPYFPALEGVKIEAFEGYILLTCTDLDAAITVKVPAVVSEPGVLCAPAKDVASVLKARPGVTTSFAKGALDSIPLETCEPPPAITPTGDPIHFTLPDTSGIRYAMAYNEVRYMLNGLCVELGGTISRMIAADGVRLALTTVPDHVESPRQVIIPQQIVRLLPKEDVGAALYDNHVVLSHGGTAWATKLVDARYMDVDSVLKAMTITLCSVTVPTYVLLDIAQQAVTLEGKEPVVKLSFDASILEVSLVQGIAHRVPCEYGGKPQKAFFNAKLLLECAKTLQDPAVIDVQKDQRKTPLVIRQGSTVHLLMPRRF